jgi:hypothetical protein
MRLDSGIDNRLGHINIALREVFGASQTGCKCAGEDQTQ